MSQRLSTTSAPRSAPRERTIVVDGMTVVVLRKRITNMYLRVRPPRAIVAVSAPEAVSDERVAAFVRSKSRWIVAQRSRILDTETNGRSPVWTPDAEADARRAMEERLPGLLSRWQPIIGRSPSEITIRRMTTR